ncbi:MAG: hypothetical protein J4203_03305 [Candidatus Diapherotrites archaeon]|uniref:Uncharacterized protein n=1 Tax=Candidatus Iainarchaeum sp. TaxID=3101447 RepID=A0A8T4L8B1_9ARCH|nr:hypothetical protein [Candidatus Diapherotrites archaeon]
MKYWALVSLLVLAVVLAGCTSGTGQAISAPLLPDRENRTSVFVMEDLVMYGFGSKKLEVNSEGLKILPQYGKLLAGVRAQFKAARDGEADTSGKADKSGHKYTVHFYCDRCYLGLNMASDIRVRIYPPSVKKGEKATGEAGVWSLPYANPCGEKTKIRAVLEFEDLNTKKITELESKEVEFIVRGSGTCTK